MSIMTTNPLRCVGAPQQPTVVGGGVTIPAGQTKVLEWTADRKLTVVQVGAGLTAQVWINSDTGTLNQDYHFEVTSATPLMLSAVEVRRLVIGNPGGTNLVLSGAAKNCTVLGWSRIE